MSKVEFKSFGKISRDNPFVVTITEKIDGTNACIIINNGVIIGVQSRNRLITPDDDNFGFAAWVADNNNELLALGDGYHYGEWVGEGIQKNPRGMMGRAFYLFNTHRWNNNNAHPACCEVVPILFSGVMNEDTVNGLLCELKDQEYYTAEGVVVYYHSTRSYTKHTIKAPNGKWAE